MEFRERGLDFLHKSQKTMKKQCSPSSIEENNLEKEYEEDATKTRY
jgi:hypothetical protein